MSDIQIALTTGILVIAFIGLVIDIIEKTIRKLGLSPDLGESLSCTYAVGKFYTFLSAKKIILLPS